MVLGGIVWIVYFTEQGVPDEFFYFWCCVFQFICLNISRRCHRVNSHHLTPEKKNTECASYRLEPHIPQCGAGFLTLRVLLFTYNTNTRPNNETKGGSITAAYPMFGNSGIRLVARQERRIGCPRGGNPTPATCWRRRIATNTAGSRRDGVDREAIEKLPLAGIRVLDMTRVLAGVGNGIFPFQLFCMPPCSLWTCLHT